MKTKRISREIETAAELLREGSLVAVPTETVYGLAGNGLDAQVIESIYEVKGRPAVKPISLMVPGAEVIDRLCEEVPDAARKLAAAFWPGPLTLVLRARSSVPEILRAGGETVGLRCPRQEQTLQLLRELEPRSLTAVRARWAWNQRCWISAKRLTGFSGRVLCRQRRSWIPWSPA